MFNFLIVDFLALLSFELNVIIVEFRGHCDGYLDIPSAIISTFL
ncbi:protein of unknown function [Moritella yayanosii]|uniref:Uncharacterized protein n=1 Tax=Moritella yayanosii TaxID=69539 RepID=A0A330LQU5_9GAMM|nr:protein of unknown function [Moritella yayanosii]